MPKAAAGSAKALSNSMKAKGLTKLRFYCQICQKANRDENGYKCHIESESHLRKAAALGGGGGGSGSSKSGGGVIDDFSREFQDSFVALLSRRFGTRRIKANRVYQEYIQDRHHLHMNATRWLSLTEFVKHLGREGIVHVDENEEGWFVSWIDTSPGALARQDALQKMNRQKMNDEQRERKLLQQQIERAAAAEAEAKAEAAAAEARASAGGSGSNSPPGAETGGDLDATGEGKDTAADKDGGNASNDGSAGLLQRGPDAAPLKLGISLRPSSNFASTSISTSSNMTSTPAATTTATGTTKPLQFALSKPTTPFSNVFRASSSSSSSSSAKPTPTLPATNAFKKASSASASASASNPSGQSGSRPQQLTAAERLREEELERKRRMVGPQPSAKRMRL
ncbi:hypothetical protein OC844_006655 [Tilletia horrida]|nr:hypothetical protein OC844_006655 [Tilletia horrida]